MSATNGLLSLAAMPEYLKPLREEIQTVLNDNGGSLKPRALQQLVRMDSYIKEVGRWYPFSISNCSSLGWHCSKLTALQLRFLATSTSPLRSETGNNTSWRHDRCACRRCQL